MFYWTVKGSRDYAPINSDTGDLPVYEHYVALKPAINAVQPIMNGLGTYDVIDCGYSDRITANEVKYWYNDYEFVVHHAHGSYNAVYIADASGNNYPIPLNTIQWGTTYLRWLWASSCDWFALNSIWTGSLPNNRFSSELLNGYQGVIYSSRTSGGVEFDAAAPYAMKCTRYDWLKEKLRMTPLVYPHITAPLWYFNNLSFEMKCLNTGTITVYASAEPDPTQWNVKSSSRIQVGQMNIPSSWCNGQYASRTVPIRIPDERYGIQYNCLYYDFSSASASEICWIRSRKLYSDPKPVCNPENTPALLPEMGQRVADWGQVFHGIHAILGWADETTPGSSISALDDFFRYWVEWDYPLMDSYFLSTGTENRPAIAYSKHPNDYYNWPPYYAAETYRQATNAQSSTSDACGIVWYLPDHAWHYYQPW